MSEPLSMEVPADIEAVSFDVFDTLIVRPVAKPADLFLLLESEFVARFGSSFEGFSQEREFAEWRARDLANRRTGCGEVTIDEIYTILNHRYKVSSDREIELELAFCRPRKAIVEFYRKCKELGKKIFILSDMYLARHVIEAMLRRCGVGGWDLLFVSGEEKESKREGGLYRVLEREAQSHFGVRLDQILHVGDHPKADFEQPRKAGMVARLVPKIAEVGQRFWDGCSPLPTLPHTGRAYLSLSRGLAHVYVTEESPALAEQLGFEALGPLAAAFATFVHEVSTTTGHKRIWFLAHDNLINKQAFDALYGHDLDAKEFETHVLSIPEGWFKQLESRNSSEDATDVEAASHAFREYLRGCDFRESLVVELGCRANIVPQLRELLNRNVMPHQIIGVSLMATPSDASSEKDARFGFLPTSNGSTIRSVAAPLEGMFLAPGNSLEDAGGKTVRGISSREADDFWPGAARFIEMLQPILAATVVRSSREYAQALLSRLLHHPTPDEAEVIGNRFCDGSASAPARSILNREQILSAGVIEAWRHSPWPEGLVATLSAADKAELQRHWERTGDRVARRHWIGGAHAGQMPPVFFRTLKVMLQIAHRGSTPGIRSLARRFVPARFAYRLSRLVKRA